MRAPWPASVKIGTAQIEAAFLADHLAAVYAQLGRAIGTDRGRVLLRIRRRASRTLNLARSRESGRIPR